MNNEQKPKFNFTSPLLRKTDIPVNGIARIVPASVYVSMELRSQFAQECMVSLKKSADEQVLELELMVQDEEA